MEVAQLEWFITENDENGGEVEELSDVGWDGASEIATDEGELSQVRQVSPTARDGTKE